MEPTTQQNIENKLPIKIKIVAWTLIIAGILIIANPILISLLNFLLYPKEIGTIDLINTTLRVLLSLGILILLPALFILISGTMLLRGKLNSFFYSSINLPKTTRITVYLMTAIAWVIFLIFLIWLSIDIYTGVSLEKLLSFIFPLIIFLLPVNLFVRSILFVLKKERESWEKAMRLIKKGAIFSSCVSVFLIFLYIMAGLSMSSIDGGFSFLVLASLGISFVFGIFFILLRLDRKNFFKIAS